MEEKKEEIYHAWYSNIGIKNGCSINQYIDFNNNIVTVTHVYISDYKPNFNDVIYLGKVTKWFKNIRPSNKEIYSESSDE